MASLDFITGKDQALLDYSRLVGYTRGLQQYAENIAAQLREDGMGTRIDVKALDRFANQLSDAETALLDARPTLEIEAALDVTV